MNRYLSIEKREDGRIVNINFQKTETEEQALLKAKEHPRYDDSKFEIISDNKIINIVDFCVTFFNTRIKLARLDFKDLIDTEDEVIEILDNWEERISDIRRSIHKAIQEAKQEESL